MNIKAQTLRGYIQGISGLFISKSNPGGLTPKELDILTAFLFVMDKPEIAIDSEVKHKVASLINHPIQVITNYVKKLRDKGVIDSSNRLHSLLINREVKISYEGKINV